MEGPAPQLSPPGVQSKHVRSTGAEGIGMILRLDGIGRAQNEMLVEEYKCSVTQEPKGFTLPRGHYSQWHVKCLKTTEYIFKWSHHKNQHAIIHVTYMPQGLHTWERYAVYFASWKRLGTGETVQELSTLAALPEVLGLVSSTHVTAYNHLSQQFQRIWCLLTSLGTRHAHGVHTYKKVRQTKKIQKWKYKHYISHNINWH